MKNEAAVEEHRGDDPGDANAQPEVELPPPPASEAAPEPSAKSAELDPVAKPSAESELAASLAVPDADAKPIEPDADAKSDASRSARRERRDVDARPTFSLRPIRLVAILAVVTTLVARGALPALRGSVVGISDLIDSVDVISGTLSQLLAFVLVGLIMTELWDVARAHATLALKLLLIVLCPPLMIAAVFSVVIPSPPAEMSMGLAAVAGTLLAVLGIDAARESTTRAAAWVPMLVGVASTIRGGGAFIADHTQEAARDVDSITRAFTMARISATVAFVLAGLALVLSTVWLVRHDRKLYGVRALIAIVASLFLTRVATTAIDDATPTWQVVVRRATQELVTRPAPHIPDAMIIFGVILPIALSIALLTLRRAVPAIASALAMLALVGPTAEIPLLALVGVAGALALWLASKDPRGVWAALAAAKPMAPPSPPAPPAKP